MIAATGLDASIGWFGDPDHVFRASAVLLGIGQTITTLEHLAAREELGPGGLHPWTVMRCSVPRRPAVLERVRETLFGAPGIVALLVLRLLAAVTLALATAEALTLVAVVTLAALLVTFSVRLRWGQEAADDISVQVALGLSAFAVCRWFDVPSIGLYYIAAFAALAYATSGVTKLGSPLWREGVALGWVANLRSLGAPWAADLLWGRRRLRVALSWAVMVGEVCFPLALLLPAPGVVAVLAAGLLFHLATAVVMGLNTFVWAFAATYPAVLLSWTALHR
ncbi:MAG TPA: hypothetical protein P5254_03670 [Aquihabitans sp.]|nr:hypothetical protein [Aquihabitans sp.]